MIEMDVDDILTTIFLVTFLISAVEFLILGAWKIYEILSWNTSYFVLSIVAPVIAIVTLIILLVKS